MIEAAALSPVRRRASADRAVLAAFGITLFLSALLLFAVQPLFAKMVLPRLGGTPAVWSVAMVFFQAMLLAGYLYAHLLVRYAGQLGALIVHGAVIVGAALWLPIAIAPGYDTPPQSGLSMWLLAAFAASVGAPFFAVSANAPLLQAWFSRTGHPHAADPYFLYGASNIGSFAALLSYPIVLEPLLSLGAQSRLWAAGYLMLAAAIGICWIAARSRHGYREAQAVASDTTPRTTVDWRMRFGWIGWAFLPSALLVAVTAHLSTNVAAAPFLWVVPLAIYLLSFMLAFQRTPLIPRRAMQLLLPVMVVGAALTMLGVSVLGMFGAIAVNIFALFVVAMAWHGELYAHRPSTSHLTEFYLFMSVGGVLGGAFASLAAPVIFETVLEFPLLLAASLIVVPECRAIARRPIGAVLGAIAALALAAVILNSPVEYQDRSFFGVLRTKLTNDGAFRLLMHGTTLHGAQRLSEVGASPSGRPEPLTYYAAGGPMAAGIAIERARAANGKLSVGVVGLGAGSLACYAAPGDTWRFFEIDPSVMRIARDPAWFTFLRDCAPTAAIVQGDARLTLAADPHGGFDVLVLDAFSSDAIPVHLLTREALRLYARKVRPGGVVLLHISNLYMELESVVGASAAAEGLAAAALQHTPDPQSLARLHKPSHVVALAADPARLAPYLEAGWKPLLPDAEKAVVPWTDDYSNVLAAILRMQGLL